MTIAAALLGLSLLFGCDEQRNEQSYERGQIAYNAGDYETALREWRPLAEQGHADAQKNLGYIYDEGLGVLQNDEEAVRWYRLAAEQGHADGQYVLGKVYSDGRGIPQDLQVAYMWLSLAAAQGVSDAASERDMAGFFMTAEQRSRAQQMSQQCLQRNYQGC